MKELGITKGEWAITRSGMDWVVRANPTAIARIYSSWECEDADAELICDAGNTAQKCGLLPSELLRQRDELKEAVNGLLFIATGKGEPCGVPNWDIAERRAIAAIKNTCDSCG